MFEKMSDNEFRFFVNTLPYYELLKLKESAIQNENEAYYNIVIEKIRQLNDIHPLFKSSKTFYFIFKYAFPITGTFLVALVIYDIFISMGYTGNYMHLPEHLIGEIISFAIPGCLMLFVYIMFTHKLCKVIICHDYINVLTRKNVPKQIYWNEILKIKGIWFFDFPVFKLHSINTEPVYFILPFNKNSEPPFFPVNEKSDFVEFYKSKLDNNMINKEIENYRRNKRMAD
jgi:hypothetical protein